MDRETFRLFGHKCIDWLADYWEEIEKYPVRSQVKAGEVKGKLPSEPPEEAEPMENIFNDFQDVILPGITHWQHPGWFAYFPANASPPSVLAEVLTAGLGAQCMMWLTSPAATELEEVVLEWLRGMIGLPEGWAGVIQDTASTATLCALLTARERATSFDSNQRGLIKPLAVYASREAHSSVEKGVKIAGLGRDALRYISTDEDFALVPGELERELERDRREGVRPACVIATTGTTSSTACDPLEPIGRICNTYGVWLHVDAAFAGTAALLPEKRHLLHGVEHADSFVFNPHKWMLTNFDCSAYFVKDSSLLTRTFEIHPEYLKTGLDAQVKNFRDWGIQLGRRFRALKLWFVIRSYGVEGIRKMLREHLRLAGVFQQLLQSDPGFEILAPVNLTVICFRMKREGMDEDELERLNSNLLERVNASGKAFLTHTKLQGRYCMRLAIGQANTTERHIRTVWDLLQDESAHV